MASGSNDRSLVRDTAKDTPEVQQFSRRWVNLADERLGACVTSVSDEFYAPAQRLLAPKPATHYFFDEHGMRWVDGWETTRRRTDGHDWCVVRLGRRGSISGAVFDTSFFSGNFPLGVELEAGLSDGDAEPAEWHRLVSFERLEGNAQRLVRVDDTRTWSHVRLHLHPDGGMARLRVFGSVDTRRLAMDATVDLSALENGGRVLGCNDAHFFQPTAMIAPGPSVTWGKGWETRRRREPGHDWAVLALAVPGFIERVEIDTTYFVANQPARFSLQAARLAPMDDALVLNQAMHWPSLLAETPVRGGANESVTSGLADIGPVSHVRLNIFPDGGVSRLRLWGRRAA